mmetsp:Transcript_14617/g.20665  ORF Transcript_14617/g.20665 Transcript_14617/m.20665 type:complete len:87 (+) Transcript_14617:343-603(+)
MLTTKIDTPPAHMVGSCLLANTSMAIKNVISGSENMAKVAIPSLRPTSLFCSSNNKLNPESLAAMIVLSLYIYTIYIILLYLHSIH